ncbi:hypothetical protein [Candidatus Lokiarchaeum ossiferum]|uniref:hypothetical protein n=1 Tax=Candidatus Lokiarchaeum ossiferum TaxID=2951803 RepID=UPI00352C9B42
MNPEQYLSIIRNVRNSIAKGHLIPMDYIQKRFPVKVYAKESTEYMNYQLNVFIKMEIAALTRYMNGELVN